LANVSDIGHCPVEQTLKKVETCLKEKENQVFSQKRSGGIPPLAGGVCQKEKNGMG
jgi:hypothetical protein